MIFKKMPIALFLILLELTCNSLSAQIFDVGLRAGADMIPTSSDDDTHGGNLPLGFHAGVKSRLWILPVLTFEPEINYRWMHYYSHTAVPDADFINALANELGIPPQQVSQLISRYNQRTTKTTSYLYVPLLIGYKVNNHISISAGPELGYIVGNQDKSHIKAQVANMTLDESKTINTLNGMKRALIGLDAAIRLHLSERMSFEGRYCRSLRELEGGNSNTKSYYNFIQFSLIYTMWGF